MALALIKQDIFFFLLIFHIADKKNYYPLFSVVWNVFRNKPSDSKAMVALTNKKMWQDIFVFYRRTHCKWFQMPWWTGRQGELNHSPNTSLSVLGSFVLIQIQLIRRWVMLFGFVTLVIRGKSIHALNSNTIIYIKIQTFTWTGWLFGIFTFV